MYSKMDNNARAISQKRSLYLLVAAAVGWNVAVKREQLKEEEEEDYDEAGFHFTHGRNSLA